MKSEFDVFSSKFAQDIFLQKYSMDGLEKWDDTAKRVTEAVCSQLINNKIKEKIFNIIKERKFIPGCRSGQPLTRVDLKEALASEGVVFEEKENECVGGVCGV